MDSGLRSRNRVRVGRQLMEAALELFANQGFDATAVEQICERASVSRATFFNYFPKKEAVFAAVARARLERLRGLLDEGAELNRATLVALFVEFARQNGRLGKAWAHLAGPVLKAVAADATMPTLYREMVKTLAVVLRRLEEQGEIAAGRDATELAQAFFAAYAGSTLTALLGEATPKAAARRVESHLQFLLGEAK